VSNDENSHIPKEVVNEQRTVCCTPSLTNITGNSPVSQQPTHSKMCNKYLYDPQTAIDPHHRETMSSSCIQRIEGLRGGSCTQWGGGVGNGIHLNSNVKHEKKLTSLSVSVQAQSTVMYSPGRKPKVLDKHAWHVDNKYKPKAHNAPRPTERDCVEQSLKQQDMSGHQWSWCDSHHTSHDTTCEHVAEGGEMECAHPTHPTRQVHGPYWDQDSDDSSSSESGVRNEGPEWRAKNNTEQLSECSDELSEDLRNIREPDEELTSPQPETVHMACMRNHHHYTVYRDTNDGEELLQHDISYNGIYKNEEDLTDESEDQEDIEEDSETEGDPFVDDLELELENDLIYESDDQEDTTDESEEQRTSRRIRRQRGTPLWMNSNLKWKTGELMDKLNEY
jgi:hypothetical protein